MIRQRTVILAILALILAAMTSPEARACPVCYGDKGSSLSEGLNWAIFFLLGVTGTVLSAFAAFFLRLKKRSKMTLNGDVDPPSLN